MALLIELSGEQLDLAHHEAWATSSMLAGSDAKVLDTDGPALTLDVPGVEATKLAGRLGLAHHVSDMAVSGELEGAAGLAASIDIGNARSFRVRAHRSKVAPLDMDPKSLEAEAGAIIQERTGTRVDLASPEAEVRLLLARKAHAGLLGGSIDRKAMEGRAVRHRPFSHPVSIHPKFARAMVNVARVPEGGRIMDPFCGTGGVLIEAAMLGYTALGSDIDPRMVAGSQENLEAMGLEARMRTTDVLDAAKDMDTRPDAVVTDPPYGRSTSLHGDGTEGVLGRLYSMAASALSPGGRLVVCLPNKDLMPGTDAHFEMESVHPMKVHRTLTRHVCVLKLRF
jgi:tRNA (guanine10-N2)-dimethyltransferase